ncbi:MAG TPA: translation elongation factor Ts [Planctomycetaceae bacterium]|nr:translation elongation factor Ts [Planctomycetaceae bacterium]
MAEITAAAVKALRDLTDLPMMECKKALVEANGDQEKAIEILRSSFRKVQLKRADNPTTEGVIAIAIKEDGSEGAMIELQCETAPVAANEEFQSLADQCARQLLDGPGAGTPEELLAQPAPDREGMTLQQVYEETVNKIREKIVLSRIVRVEGPVAGYVHHDKKIGVLFRASGENATDPILRDVAMHIAALKPTVTYPEELDPEKVQKERERLTEEAKATGKPDNIIEKIVEGRMKNFYLAEGVLVLQPFAKDDTKTVRQVLAERGFKAVGFERWVLGT